MVRDEPVQQAHAVTRATLRHGRFRLAAPCDTGDIEMRPRHAVAEALQELRCGHAAAVAAADILHVGDVERTSVVEGKSVSVRVDLGGRRIIRNTQNIRMIAKYSPNQDKRNYTRATLIIYCSKPLPK